MKFTKSRRCSDAWRIKPAFTQRGSQQSSREQLLLLSRLIKSAGRSVVAVGQHEITVETRDESCLFYGQLQTSVKVPSSKALNGSCSMLRRKKQKGLEALRGEDEHQLSRFRRKNIQTEEKKKTTCKIVNLKPADGNVKKTETRRVKRI